MNKIFSFIMVMLGTISVYASNDTVTVNTLNDVSVVGFYRNNINTGSLLSADAIANVNVAQEPSHVFKGLPSVFSMSDNGTEYGYGYYRIRGLDQTRINVTLDGCPWNEAEDYGTYFANSPSLMGSMHSIKVERGTSSMYNGTAGVAGGINMESVDLYTDTVSYANVGAGSYNTYTTGVTYNMGDKNGWGLHIRGTHSQTDGYRDYSSNNSNAFALKTGYKFNANHSIDFLSMLGFHRNGQGWIGNTKTELATNKHANGNSENDNDRFFTTFNRVQYKGKLADNLYMNSAVYFQYQDGDYNMDLDNYMYRMVDPTWLPGTTGCVYNYGLRYYMIGVNAAAKYIGSNYNVIAGVNTYKYERNHFLGHRSVNVDPAENYDNTGTKYDVAPFVNASYNVTEDLKVTANAQYRYVSFDYTDNLTSTPYSVKDMGTYWNFLNWGAGVEYNVLANLKAYARYNYVNREPTRSDMFGGNEWFIGSLATNESESANDIEVGVEYVSDKLNFNINGYYMKFKNELVLNGQYGLNGLPCHENAKDSYRMGVEVSEEWNAFDKVWFNNNFAFSKNKVKTAVYGTTNHILTPSVTWNTDIAYRAKNWNAVANFNYRNGMCLDMDNAYKTPEAWTVNISGSYKFANNIEVGGRLNNVTDRTNYCTGAVNGMGEMLYFPMAGRTVFGDVKVYF